MAGVERVEPVSRRRIVDGVVSFLSDAGQIRYCRFDKSLDKNNTSNNPKSVPEREVILICIHGAAEVGRLGVWVGRSDKLMNMQSPVQGNSGR